MGLQNKNIIITGGSRGIGKSIVELFISKGANVFFTYTKDFKAAENVENLSCRYDGNAKSFMVDARDYFAVKDFAKHIFQKYGSIDILINNAGIRRDKSLLFMEKEDWDDVIETNLTGIFYMTKSVIPYMLKKRSGRVVNISSVSGISGISGQTNYSSSKSGVIGFTKSLAKETAVYGICVNAIAPGAVDTELLVGLSKKNIDRLLSDVPIKRMCTPEEVALVVNFLADEEMSPQYLTGQVISLDGGAGM